jgi:hypothetical protein
MLSVAVFLKTRVKVPATELYVKVAWAVLLGKPTAVYVKAPDCPLVRLMESARAATGLSKRSVVAVSRRFLSFIFILRPFWECTQN